MSPFLLDLAYLGGAAATAPVWVARMARTGKLRTDWRARLGYASPLPPKDARPRLLIHAVSVGEVNAARLLVDDLAAQAVDVVVCTTTDTGFARATAIFGTSRPVLRYPFDFSSGVRRFLDAVQPDGVALVELEVWPNFVAECRRRGIPVAVINGRLSARSFRRYRPLRPLLRGTFGTLTAVGAQDLEYAERFAALGVEARRVAVTGTMKWDTAQIVDSVEGSAALAEEMGIDRARPLVVAGSTAPAEHALLRDALPAGVQLLCAPRKPEWFDAAAEALPGCVRRSRPGQGRPSSGRFLLDTIGELRKAYALADVAVVGRTFVPLGGSDMIEPVGLGKATVIGPHVDNFLDSVEALDAGGGLARIDAASLASTLSRLLANPEERLALARRGRAVIVERQGATRRTTALLRSLLEDAPRPPAAASPDTDTDSDTDSDGGSRP